MRKLSPWVLGFFVIMLAGCAGTQARDKADLKKNELLEPAVMQKFSDIPVPSKFKFIAENSYTFENSGMRVGVLKYRGKADPDQVTAFFKEQMPMYNWRLLNVVEYGDRLMNFDRERETCIITIMANGNNIELIAAIGPKPQAGAKKLN